MIWRTASGAHLALYGGARASATPTGSATATQGSRIVTGAGATWLSGGIEKGHLFNFSAGAYAALVESVNTNTQITLRDPWPVAGNTSASYGFSTVKQQALQDKEGTWSLPIGTPLGAIGVAGRRLLAVLNERVYFSEIDTPGDFVEGNFHDLPSFAIGLGIEELAGDGLVFTTAGVWAISGLLFDALNDFGDIQHRVEQLNELILWGETGLAKYRGAVVVPAVDDVWLMPPGAAPVPIGAGIRPLYLDYVKAGYQPGLAATHRGHYFLPILNGTTWVDTLVCRLDREFAWTRWAGHGAGVAYAQRIGSTTRSPKLFSVSGQRVTELSDAWSASAANASEADATTHTVRIDSRDLPTPGGRLGSTTRKVMVRYNATAAGAATITASYARGPEGAAYSALPLARDTGGGVSDGLDASVWTVNKRAPAIRFRLESTSALSTFTLRSIEAVYTERGA
jgi:hypothetical protein